MICCRDSTTAPINSTLCCNFLLLNLEFIYWRQTRVGRLFERRWWRRWWRCYHKSHMPHQLRSKWLVCVLDGMRTLSNVLPEQSLYNAGCLLLLMYSQCWSYWSDGSFIDHMWTIYLLINQLINKYYKVFVIENSWWFSMKFLKMSLSTFEININVKYTIFIDSNY